MRPALRNSALFCTFFWVVAAAYGQEARSAKTDDEALIVNRISAFWEEGEYAIAQRQMESFLLEYPESSFGDVFRAALGDLALKEKNALEALGYYTDIQDPSVAASHFSRKMECLYSLGWYPALVEEARSFLENHPTLALEEKKSLLYYLAFSLYQQCLDRDNLSPEEIEEIAAQAIPYFETLWGTSFKSEILDPFAYLCYCTKNFPKAAELYLGEMTSANREEMLFQAALMQVEYDGELALSSLRQVVSLQGNRQEIASEWLLQLYFQLNKHLELLEQKEALLLAIPEKVHSLAHFFFGKSLCALERWEEAALAFQFCAERQGEIQRLGFISLFDVFFETKNVEALSSCLSQFCALYPQDEVIPKAEFSKALLLIAKDRLEEAEKTLSLLAKTELPPSLEADVAIELIYLHYELKNWNLCCEKARQFVQDFPLHAEFENMAHYLIFASKEMATQTGDKELFCRDLGEILKNKGHLEAKAWGPWQYLLASTYVSLKQYEEGISLFEELLSCSEETSLFPADIAFSLALCYRDGLQDVEKYLLFAEKTLELTQNSTSLVDLGTVHALLYNGYLEKAEKDPAMMEKAEFHLFAALQKQAEIPLQNLIYFAHRYSLGNAEEKQKAMKIFERVEFFSLDEQAFVEKPFLEEAAFALARLYAEHEKNEEAKALLGHLMDVYGKVERAWDYYLDACLLQAKLYEQEGSLDKSLALMQTILAQDPLLKTKAGMQASLQAARLLKNKENETALSLLKTLVLKKNITQEPLHLEAACDYIDWQSLAPEKNLALLLKTKNDFEKEDDLLSKDYHQIRNQISEKNLIYQSYMHFLDAEILRMQASLAKDLCEQKELQAKSKVLLLKIIEEKVHPDLVARACQRMSVDEFAE